MTKPLSFEEQLSQLDQIVASLEKGQLPLEEALKQFESGIQLTRACQTTLTEAQSKMEALLTSYGVSLESTDVV